MTKETESLIAARGSIREVCDVLVELARWSRVAVLNGDLHARVASALAGLEELGEDTSAAVVDGPDHEIGHHETVGERQGGQTSPNDDLLAAIRLAEWLLRPVNGKVTQSAALKAHGVLVAHSDDQPDDPGLGY